MVLGSNFDYDQKDLASNGNIAQESLKTEFTKEFRPNGGYMKWQMAGYQVYSYHTCLINFVRAILVYNRLKSKMS